MQYIIFSLDTNSYKLGILKRSAFECYNVLVLTEQSKQMPEFLRASPGSAPNRGAQCFSEMTRWASWSWGFRCIKRHMLQREWQMWDLGRWEVTHKVNPQIPGEDKPCRRGKTFIWKQERIGKRDYPTVRRRAHLPSSTWSRPRSKRMCTAASDRFGFAANNLKTN